MENPLTPFDTDRSARRLLAVGEVRPLAVQYTLLYVWSGMWLFPSARTMPFVARRFDVHEEA